MCVILPAPINCTTGRITCHFTFIVLTAVTLKVCIKAFHHRVKLMTHTKTEHGVSVGKKYMQHEYFNEKLISFLHDMYTVTEMKEFKTWYAFESWKEAEVHSKCYFVRPTGKKVEIEKDCNAWEKITFSNLITSYLFNNLA